MELVLLPTFYTADVLYSHFILVIFFYIFSSLFLRSATLTFLCRYTSMNPEPLLVGVVYMPVAARAAQHGQL